MRPVAVDVVTGFLGSGKTTLLTHVLGGCLADEKVAVIVNEIGEIGIDGRVITGLEYIEDVVELNNGCICCTIDDYRFDLAVSELIAVASPTLLLIETTGVADTEPMLQRIAQAGLALDAVTTVVDAANFERSARECAVARRQVEAADFLVVNKVDLVDPRRLERVRKALAGWNPRALVTECERGRVTTDLPFGTSTRRFRAHAAGRPSPPSIPHLDADRIESFTYRSCHPLDRDRFERVLSRLPRTIYRAKGFVRIAGNPWSCLFNFTCGRYELNWVKLGEAAGATQGVFIGRDAASHEERVIRELAACEVK